MKLFRAIPRIALLGAVALTATACATARPVAAGVDIEDPLADIEKTHTTASVGDGMIMKGSRGIVNTLTGWVEFPVQIYKGFDRGVGFIENEAGSKTVGTILGIFSGVSHAVGRTGYGVLELFGFWTVNPASNERNGVPLDGKYAWNEGEPYSIFEPTLGEGIEPYPNKLVRGLGNGVGGILELPGQTIKGANEGNVVKGLGKGVWFTVSRWAYGLGDVFGFLLPNPPDQLGYAFEQKWPWDSFSDETSEE